MPKVAKKPKDNFPDPGEIWVGKRTGAVVVVVAVVKDCNTSVIVYRWRIHKDGPYFAMPLYSFRDGYERT